MPFQFTIHTPLLFAKGPLNIAVRDCVYYRRCCPWVREGWDLEGLGTFLSRRRRPHLTLLPFSTSTLRTWEVIPHPTCKFDERIEDIRGGPPKVTN